MSIFVRIVLACLLLASASVAVAANVSGTMSVAGTFAGGGSVTYTVVLTNSAGIQSDNAGNEFGITLPASLAVTGASATGGVAAFNAGGNSASWNGGLAMNGTVTITITANVLPITPGNVVSAQGTIVYDSNGDFLNDSVRPTDNPATGPALDATAFTAIAARTISATLTVGGIFAGSGQIAYTAVLNNAGPLPQADNPSNEFTITLPTSLALVSASASSGTASVVPVNRFCTWSGPMPVGVDIVITCVATINPASPGTVINAQGSIFFDRNGDNVNEASSTTDNPATGAALDATAFTTIAARTISAALTVSGTFAGSGQIAYTAVLNNAGPLPQADNPSNEFTITLPNSLALVSASASSGTAGVVPVNRFCTWSGPMPVGVDIVITCVATINPAPAGTVINAQGSVFFDRTGDNVNEASISTDNPATVGADATSLTLIRASTVRGTMTVDGAFTAGDLVLYVVTLVNDGPLPQADNPSNEFTTTLPNTLALESAIADSGATAVVLVNRFATWSGGIAVGGSVTIAIQARVLGTVPVGTAIAAQGSVFFDGTGDGVNESVATTDNPRTPAAGDPTAFTTQFDPDIFIDGFEW